MGEAFHYVLSSASAHATGTEEVVEEFDNGMQDSCSEEDQDPALNASLYDSKIAADTAPPHFDFDTWEELQRLKNKTVRLDAFDSHYLSRLLNIKPEITNLSRTREEHQGLKNESGMQGVPSKEDQGPSLHASNALLDTPLPLLDTPLPLLDTLLPLFYTLLPPYISASLDTLLDRQTNLTSYMWEWYQGLKNGSVMQGVRSEEDKDPALHSSLYDPKKVFLDMLLCHRAHFVSCTWEEHQNLKNDDRTPDESGTHYISRFLSKHRDMTASIFIASIFSYLLQEEYLLNPDSLLQRSGFSLISKLLGISIANAVFSANDLPILPLDSFVNAIAQEVCKISLSLALNTYYPDAPLNKHLIKGLSLWLGGLAYHIFFAPEIDQEKVIKRAKYAAIDVILNILYGRICCTANHIFTTQTSLTHASVYVLNEHLMQESSRQPRGIVSLALSILSTLITKALAIELTNAIS